MSGFYVLKFQLPFRYVEVWAGSWCTWCKRWHNVTVRHCRAPQTAENATEMLGAVNLNNIIFFFLQLRRNEGMKKISISLRCFIAELDKYYFCSCHLVLEVFNFNYIHLKKRSIFTVL